MRMNALSEALRRKKRKASSHNWDDGDETTAKEDGLSPDIKSKDPEVTAPEGEEDDGYSLGKEAERVLGRKPMSLTKKRSADDEEDGDEEISMEGMDMEVFGKMKDDIRIEQLKNGRKPTNLWDRVQLNIAKMKK